MTTPYADDFCLITRDKRNQQNLIDDINNQITSMGMKLKPSKCRSFSISGGTPTATSFHIGDSEISSIRDEEQKFLGKLLFFKGKPEETFNLVKDTFVKGIEKIGEAMVRNEFKLWMYTNYLLPSKRFLLTIHTLTDTQLKSLDTLTDKAIKSWAGLPPGATNALIHMPEGLDVKSISEMYKEVHTVSHTRTRLKGDHIVNSAINATIQRESEYTHKKSTCIEAETVYKVALESNTTLGQVPNFTGAQAGKLKHKFSEDVTNSVKAALNVERRQKWEEHVKSLTVQGHNLALAAAERQDLVCKSFMYDLKQGTLKFLLNAGIDTLPTAANLKRWKKSPSDLCKLCRCRQTTDHVLSNCKMALESGRYTWRHNCIINYIVNSVDEKFTVYSDLPGHTAPGGGSIPPEICVTPLKPDIVIIDNQKQTIHLFELTCPSERNIEA